MTDSKFFEAMLNSITNGMDSKNKAKLIKQMGGKVSKMNLNNTTNYSDIENALQVSIDVFHKNKYVHKSAKPSSKHASLVLGKNGIFTAVPHIVGGGENDQLGIFTSRLKTIVLPNNPITRNVTDYVLSLMPQLNRDMMLSELSTADKVALKVILKQFQPEEADIAYMLVVISKMDNVTRQTIMSNWDSPVRQSLGLQGGEGEEDDYEDDYEDEDDYEEEDFKPTPISDEITPPGSNSMTKIIKNTKNVLDLNINMSIQNFFKLFVLICFLGAFILNPVLQYVGFHRMMNVLESQDEGVYGAFDKGTMNLPDFYLDNRPVQYTIKEGRLFYQNPEEVSNYGQVFLNKVLNNPVYLMQNVLPHVKFVPSDILKNEQQDVNNKIKNDFIPVFEKIYETMYKNVDIVSLPVTNHISIFDKYFDRLFGSRTEEVLIDGTVFTYMETALSKMYNDEKQRVLNYNRAVLSKYKNELINLIVTNDQIIRKKAFKKLQNNFDGDYEPSMALTKVNAIKYCLSTPGFTEVDRINHVVNCVEIKVLTPNDLLYAKQFENFKDFFNNLGLLYNQVNNQDSQFTDKTVSFIKNSVQSGYNDYLYIGVSGFKNAFMSQLTQSIDQVSLTPTETIALKNLKNIGGMNVFNIFLDMYSEDIQNLIPGGKLIKNIVNSLTNFANTKLDASVKQFYARLVLSIENDIKLKEMFFSHTNYDTDIMINLLKRIGKPDSGSSLTKKAFQAVSQTNIDLFVDIKMKNIVLQILNIVSGSTTNDTRRLSASLTDLFYIIPYYTHKYYNNVEMEGGKNNRTQSKNKKRIG